MCTCPCLSFLSVCFSACTSRLVWSDGSEVEERDGFCNWTLAVLDEALSKYLTGKRRLLNLDKQPAGKKGSWGWKSKRETERERERERGLIKKGITCWKWTIDAVVFQPRGQKGTSSMSLWPNQAGTGPARRLWLFVIVCFLRVELHHVAKSMWTRQSPCPWGSCCIHFAQSVCYIDYTPTYCSLFKMAWSTTGYRSVYKTQWTASG